MCQYAVFFPKHPRSSSLSARVGGHLRPLSRSSLGNLPASCVFSRSLGSFTANPLARVTLRAHPVACLSGFHNGVVPWQRATKAEESRRTVPAEASSPPTRTGFDDALDPSPRCTGEHIDRSSPRLAQLDATHDPRHPFRVSGTRRCSIKAPPLDNRYCCGGWRPTARRTKNHVHGRRPSPRALVPRGLAQGRDPLQEVRTLRPEPTQQHGARAHAQVPLFTACGAPRGGL